MSCYGSLSAIQRTVRELALTAPPRHRHRRNSRYKPVAPVSFPTAARTAATNGFQVGRRPPEGHRPGHRRGRHHAHDDRDDTRARAQVDMGLSLLRTVVERRGRVRAGSRGRSDHLVKPFSPEELAARVRCVLRRSRPAQDRPSACGSTRGAATSRSTDARSTSRQGVRPAGLPRPASPASIHPSPTAATRVVGKPEPPVPLSPVVEVMSWTSRHEHDPAHVWLRQQLHDLANDI